MIEIYKVLRRIYETQFKPRQIEEWSEEYEKSYRYCLSLLLLAIENHPALNLHVEYMRLEKRTRQEREKLLKELDQLQRQLATKEESNRRLNGLIDLQSQSSLKRLVADLQTQVYELQSSLIQRQELMPKTDSQSVQEV